MVDIPLDAKTECSDGPCGRSIGVIIEPSTWQVTHFVVEESSLSRTKRLVPADWVVHTIPDSVRLRCKKSKLAVMEPFVESQHVLVSRLDYTDYLRFRGICSVHDNAEWISVRHERIPRGQLVVRWGARVRATNGQVGQVDEFLVDPNTKQITHLVLRKGHLWNQKDVLVPISEIEHVGKDLIYLKLDKNAVELLPAIPAQQWHARKAA